MKGRGILWYQESVIYQIYSLGFCGAPPINDGKRENRILKVIDWAEYLKKLGVGSVLFNPVFESDSHGYDTRDYTKLDCRLGSNQDFSTVCQTLHEHGLKVILDGVFNHVGRGFWAFQDVKQHRESSIYKDWFHINFEGNSNYNDGFWYEGWEGHYELVKLNLENSAVVEHLLSCVGGWIDEFDIDGIRLDVAYCLDKEFMKKLRQFTDTKKSDFFLIGEMLHGDYKTIVNAEMLHSATNYECYKGLYSSFNTMNMFEIAHSINRQYGPEDWTLYKGIPMLTFVDNHDVTRVASILENQNHLSLIYGLLIGMPGIPCLYYGSEWGALGKKEVGSDASLRPSFEQPQTNETSDFVAQLCHIRSASEALSYGDYRQVHLTNQQYVFERKTKNERILIGINAAPVAYTVHFDAGCGMAEELITGQKVDFGGGLKIEPFSILIMKMEH